jgi:hypothetical protein
MPRIRSIKQPVGKRTMLPRVARHGRLLTDVYRVRTEAVSRIVTELDKVTGEYRTFRKVVQQAVDRPMTGQEIEEHRNNVLRAYGSTQGYGKKNDGGSGAGKKKVKA